MPSAAPAPWTRRCSICFSKRASTSAPRERAESAAQQQQRGAPRRERQQRDACANELDEQIATPHVLSSPRQKKGARAPARNQAALERRHRERVGIHHRLPQKPRSSPTTLPSIFTGVRRGSTTIGAIVGWSGLSTTRSPSRAKRLTVASPSPDSDSTSATTMSLGEAL